MFYFYFLIPHVPANLAHPVKHKTLSKLVTTKAEPPAEHEQVRGDRASWLVVRHWWAPPIPPPPSERWSWEADGCSDRYESRTSSIGVYHPVVHAQATSPVFHPSASVHNWISHNAATRHGNGDVRTPFNDTWQLPLSRAYVHMILSHHVLLHVSLEGMLKED